LFGITVVFIILPRRWVCHREIQKLCQLVPYRKAEDEGAAQQLQQGHRLTEQRHRYDNGHQRIDIAENGGFLSRYRFKIGEIEAVGHAGMYKAEDQQAEQTFAVEDFGMEPRGAQDIGQKHGNSGQKLQDGAVEARHTGDRFVEQHDEGIEHGCTQTEGNAQAMVCAAGTGGDGDQYDAEGRHGKAEDAPAAELFLEEDRGEQGHQYGGKIIAEGGDRNGGVFVGLEEQDPVEAHGGARKGQLGQVAAQRTQVGHAADGQQIKGDKGGGQQGAVEGQLTRRYRNGTGKEGDGAPYGHGKDDLQAGFVVVGHGRFLDSVE